MASSDELVAHLDSTVENELNTRLVNEMRNSVLAGIAGGPLGAYAMEDMAKLHDEFRKKLQKAVSANDLLHGIGVGIGTAL